jgi:hypothetical protein
VSRELEGQPLPEITPELVEAYAAAFLNRVDCYPLQLSNGKFVRVKQPLTWGLVNAHLRGALTLGAYALDAQSRARWLCCDVDDADSFSVLQQMARDLQAQTIPAYLERSRHGGHLWLFTTPLPGAALRRFGRQLLIPYSLPKVELYPKQERLTSGSGSLVRLPLGIHRKSGKRYSFITLEDQPLAPTIRQQIALLAHPVRVPPAFIAATLAGVAEPSLLLPKSSIEKAKWAAGRTLSERLKSAISVYDFVSRYVELNEQGKGLCPFHDDQHPSFQVNRERNYWSCYAGCGGGSIIDFMMKWRQAHGQDGSFTATVKDLATLLF